jgi:hypothetical protein
MDSIAKPCHARSTRQSARKHTRGGKVGNVTAIRKRKREKGGKT